MNNLLIEIDKITAAYDGRVVLRELSLTLYERDFLGIIGPNGGGKTTLLKVILGLVKPVAGQVRFYQAGKQVGSLKMGYLPQISRTDRKFPVSVREVVASGLMSEKPLMRRFTSAQKQQIDQVMEQMGVEELASRPIGELSGGQLQRVLLGRAIVSRPQVLILDEPGSYVDKPFEARFYPLLEEINRESAILLVSHDLHTVEHLAKQTLLIDN
jgi:zinc transport system ATP-binding protein